MRLVPCVGAVIRDDGGRIVVVRRGHAPAVGLWSIPGGRVEAGESSTDAVRREVLEETGLEVEVGEVVGCIELDASDSGGDGGGHSAAVVRYAVTDFYATPLDPTAALLAGDDALEARWVTQGELAELATSPGLADTLGSWNVWAFDELAVGVPALQRRDTAVVAEDAELGGAER